MKHRTTETLREYLFVALEQVREGAIDTGKAKAIAALADNILKTADMEIRYALTCDRLDRGKAGISVGPVLLTERREGTAE